MLDGDDDNDGGRINMMCHLNSDVTPPTHTLQIKLMALGHVVWEPTMIRVRM